MRSRFRAAVYGGTLLVVLALTKVHASWIARHPYGWYSTSRFRWSLAYAVALSLFAYGAGLPDLVRSRRQAIVAAASTTIGAAAIVWLMQLITGRRQLPLFVILGAILVLAPWFVFCWWRAQRGHNQAQQRDRVLLVGPESHAEELADELRQSRERPAMLVGVVSVDEARILQAGERPLVRRAEALGVTVVVLDHDAQVDETVVAQAGDLHEAGVRIRTLSFFYEEWLAKLPVEDLQRISLMFDIGEVHRALYARTKRLLDVPIALLGLIALALAIPVVLLGNLIANRGPLFYRQQRVGMAGRHFQILKFRTMRPSAGGLANEWTADDDPRITPFGRLLRRSHIDEIPQVVNVLRGDLAIVGPRPEQPHYVEELSQKLPYYDLRHLVHPGVTGWAQIKYGYAGDERDALEKLQYEFFYLRKQGLVFDLRIIGRTIRALFGTEGGGR